MMLNVHITGSMSARIKLLKECKPAISAIQAWFYATYSIHITTDDAIVFSMNTVDEIIAPLRASVQEWGTYSKYCPEDFISYSIKKNNMVKFRAGLKRLSNLNYPISAVISAVILLRVASLPHDDRPLMNKMVKAFGHTIYHKKSKYLPGYLKDRVGWEKLDEFFNQTIRNVNAGVTVGIDDWGSPIEIKDNS